MAKQLNIPPIKRQKDIADNSPVMKWYENIYYGDKSMVIIVNPTSLS